ncbi:hypothetical protein [Flavobacterium sp.]|uniref:hypothetical protein n=1 Tax=Flavobacterium sp. TaxID=239 RepID=UPI003752C574
MKNFLSKYFLLSASAAFLLLSFTSCVKKIKFLTSSVVPAALGYVTIKKDKNKNYVIKIKIEELAEVKKLEPSKNRYIVWMETEELMVKNMGQIISDTRCISSKLKAEFETVTAFKPTKIFITAEDDAEIQYPGTQFILETNRF